MAPLSLSVAHVFFTFEYGVLRLPSSRSSLTSSTHALALLLLRSFFHFDFDFVRRRRRLSGFDDRNRRQARPQQCGRNLQLLGRESSRPSHAARFVCRHRRLSGSGDIICEWVGFIFRRGRVGTEAEEVFKCGVPSPLRLHTPLASLVGVVAFLARAIETASASFLISAKAEEACDCWVSSLSAFTGRSHVFTRQISVSPRHRYQILSHKRSIIYWI